MHRIVVAALLALTAAVAGCNDDEAADAPVVVSADGPFSRALVERLAGGVEGIELAPMSNDASGADMVVVAGPAVADGGEAVVVDLLAELAPIPFGQDPPYRSLPPPSAGRAAGGAEAGEPDPAFWFDPDRVAQAAVLVEQAMAAAGYDGDGVAARVGALQAELAEADERVQTMVSAVPETRRVLVTDRRNLGYFAERYGFTLVPVAVAVDTNTNGASIDDQPPESSESITTAIVDLASAVVAATGP